MIIAIKNKEISEKTSKGSKKSQRKENDGNHLQC